MPPLALLLPRPGPVWGEYPQRQPDSAPAWRGLPWRSAAAP